MENVTLSSISYYRPKTKLREGNVLHLSVSHSVHGGGCILTCTYLHPRKSATPSGSHLHQWKSPTVTPEICQFANFCLFRVKLDCHLTQIIPILIVNRCLWGLVRNQEVNCYCIFAPDFFSFFFILRNPLHVATQENILVGCILPACKPHVLQRLPPYVTLGGGGGRSSSEQVWTSLQCWPKDVSIRGPPGLMSRGEGVSPGFLMSRGRRPRSDVQLT